MRVLHVTYQHPADDARILHKQCRSLAEAGHDVRLMAPPPAPQQLFGVRFQPLSPRAALPKPQQLRRWFAEVEQYVSQSKPDVVHMHDAMLLPAARRWKTQCTGVTFVYDVHEDHPRQIRALTHLSWPRRTAQATYYAHVERDARKWIDLFVAATPGIAQLYPKDRTITVLNLPRLEEFAAAPRRNPAPALIYVGGLTRSRGVIEMIDAVAALKTPNARLALVGRFDSDDTKRIAQSRAGWSRVDFHGWVDHARVPELLRQAAAGLVLLHPTPNYLDAWPVKLFEYMAARLPFVASDFPAWKTLGSHEATRRRSDAGMNECGLFVDPRNVSSIAEACDSILEHPDEADRMGAAGRALIERELNWERESRVLLEGYARLAAAPAP